MLMLLLLLLLWLWWLRLVLLLVLLWFLAGVKTKFLPPLLPIPDPASVAKRPGPRRPAAPHGRRGGAALDAARSPRLRRRRRRRRDPDHFVMLGGIHHHLWPVDPAGWVDLVETAPCVLASIALFLGEYVGCVERERESQRGVEQWRVGENGR